MQICNFPRNTSVLRVTLLTAMMICAPVMGFAQVESTWLRHVIDDDHQGADGVRLGDFNSDGRSDVVTGWEESGLVRLYLNPGPTEVRSPWPAVTIGNASSPEDAVPIDLDNDGRPDVVSCHEGKQRQLIVHWNDSESYSTTDLLKRSSWTLDRFRKLDGVMWMFATPIENINGRSAFVVGAKGAKASITLMLGPTGSPHQGVRRDLSQWTAIRLRDAGWIMSLRKIDMDGDGDEDIVFTDRKGKSKRAGWLEQPPDPMQPWPEHVVAGDGMEVMFLAASPDRWLIAARTGSYLDCLRQDSDWNVLPVKLPKDIRNGKAIERFPDGSVVITANTHASSTPRRPGIWRRDLSGKWTPIDATPKVKFDRMELIDLDNDGDLDVMTCEERQNLGVIWYENPSVP